MHVSVLCRTSKYILLGGLTVTYFYFMLTKLCYPDSNTAILLEPVEEENVSVGYQINSYRSRRFSEHSRRNEIIKWIVRSDFTASTQDVKVYENLFKCCYTTCVAERTSTKTNNATCNQNVVNAVSPVKCEIARSLLVEKDSEDELLLDDCKPQIVSYKCENLSQSTLPCNKTFQILQYDYHTQYHCLVRIVDRVHKRRTTKVPRIHHQVWLYGDKVKFEFYQYISMIATLRFFRPELIFLWNDGYLPSGKWWQEFIGHVNQIETSKTLFHPLEGEALRYGSTHNITKRTVCLYDVAIVSVVRQKPQTIYGHKFFYKEHLSDVVRLEAMLLFGGFYTDTDTIAINNLDPLLNISVSMAEESPLKLTNMAILGERYSPHFYAWHHNYVNFSATDWVKHSVEDNMVLARLCPDFVNVEKRMIDPSWDEKHLYYDGDKDLSKNFVIHLFWRNIEHKVMRDPLEILKAPFLGPRLFRNIYYSCTRD